MAGGIVTADGALATGVMGLYHLPGGVFLFCECAEEKDGSYVFPATKSVSIKIKPGMEISLLRADKFPGTPTKLRISKMGIMVSDCTDEELVLMARSEISGLVVAQGGGPR